MNVGRKGLEPQIRGCQKSASEPLSSDLSVEQFGRLLSKSMLQMCGTIDRWGLQ